MDFRTVMLFCLAVLLAMLLSFCECRTKKVVIHVPVKVKKIRHTHTIYKTVHHHHTHHDHLDHLDHHLEHLDPLSISPSEDHEHFHHLHLHEEPPVGQHSRPVPGIGIPEFLPDVPMDLANVAHDIPGIANRHVIPIYRRND